MLQIKDIGALHAAYCATTYRIHGPWGPLDVRLDGALPQALPDLLQDAGYPDGPWTIVTAYNPRSHHLPDTENRCRQRALENTLRALGFPWFACEHIADSGDWPVEWGAWAAGMDLAAARQLGAHYDQAAIVVGSGRKQCQLEWLA